MLVPQVAHYKSPSLASLSVGSEEFLGEIKHLRLFDCALSPGRILQVVEDAMHLTSTHLFTVSSALWADRSFWDCIVKADNGSQWNVHKCVIAGASSVFGGMLASSTYSVLPVPVFEVKDAAPEDIEAFLHYLYMGRLPSRESQDDVHTDAKCWSAAGVLDLADLYDVKCLLSLTVTQLENIMTSTVGIPTEPEGKGPGKRVSIIMGGRSVKGQVVKNEIGPSLDVPPCKMPLTGGVADFERLMDSIG